MKRALCLQRREAFCLAYMTGIGGSQAALSAGYAQRNPRNAHVMAWFLLKQPTVRSRLAELAEATADEAIMTVIQRKVRLSEMARDPDSKIDPIRCIEELNRMDGLYHNKKLEVNVPSITSVSVTEKIKRQIERHNRE